MKGDNILKLSFMLEKHEAYNWVKTDKFAFRGTFFYQDKLYTNENVSNLISIIIDFNDLLKKVLLFNGNFLLVYKLEDCYYIFNDKIMSFPIFIKMEDKIVKISDDINKLKENDKFNESALTEIAAFGYTLGNKTIYNNIINIGAGEYVKIDLKEEKIEEKTYYSHLHKEINDLDENVWLQKLDDVINNTFNRFIERVNGRQVVLFLSGGYDSRLILQNLRKRNYENVICISLRACNDLDVQVAKKIADSFNYKLYVFDYTKEYWRAKSQEKDFWNLINKFFNGFAIHYPQGLIIKDLLYKNIINNDSIIVTGNSGDVVEGNDVCENFKKEQVNTPPIQIAHEILKTHSLNVMNYKNVYNLIIKNVIDLLPQKTDCNFAEAQDAYEYFNWKARQCKYVTSDARNYDDYTGNEWALPLWDDEFVAFWLSVPIELRYKRRLYYKYVNKDNLPTANVPTLYGDIRSLLFKYCENITKVFYPFRQIYGFYGNSIPFVYHGVISIYDWMYLLWITKGNKVKFITVFTYKLFKEIYGFNIFKLVKEVNKHGKT